MVLMETGRLTYIPVIDDLPRPNLYVSSTKRPFTGEFNMSEWSRSHTCGTVCCIGGTAELVGGIEIDEMATGALYRLFYPKLPQASLYADVTVEQAARALRSYLTTGDAKWSEAVAS